MDNDNALKSLKTNTPPPPEEEISSADKTSEPPREATPVEKPEEKPVETPEPVLPETPAFNPEQPLPSTEPNKKKSRLAPILIVFLMLLLTACGACYYISVYRPDLNPFAKSAPAPAKVEPVEESGGTKEAEAPELSNSELHALVDTYFTEELPCDYLIFEKLSDGNNPDFWKRDFAWSKISSKHEGTYDETGTKKYFRDLSYEELNKTYQTLFGSDETATKSPEAVESCFRLNYDETENLFYVGSGCECIQFLTSAYEILSEKKDDDLYEITISVTNSVKEDFDNQSFVEASDTTYPETTKYLLTFKYDPTLEKYVLKDSEKLK